MWRGQQGALWEEVRSGAGTSQSGCGKEKRAQEGILGNSNILRPPGASFQVSASTSSPTTGRFTGSSREQRQILLRAQCGSVGLPATQASRALR